MELIDQLLAIGITPAGILLGAFIITWIAILFYFLPRLQASDECLGDYVETIKNVKEQLDNQKQEIQSVKKLVESLLSDVNKLVELSNEVDDFFSTIKNVHSLEKEEINYYKSIYINLNTINDTVADIKQTIKNILLMTVIGQPTSEGDDNIKNSMLMKLLLESNDSSKNMIKSRIDLFLDGENNEEHNSE